MELSLKVIAASLFLLVSLCLAICAGQNQLAAGKHITGTQTLVSSGGVFVLGFFVPNSSTTNHYVGIWYKEAPDRPVVWVANRENPIVDSSGTLKITDDGNIALLDGNGRTAWSSNVSSNAPSNTTATILDSGNLVLVGGDGKAVWESFDHPTDTLLPSMRLRFNLTSGTAQQQLVSWKSSVDPSPGDMYVGFDPGSPLQLVLRKGSGHRWRYGLWNIQSSNSAQIFINGGVFVETFMVTHEEVYYMYTPMEDISLMRMVAEPTGMVPMAILYWTRNLKQWIVLWSGPSTRCEMYNICGQFGTCDRNESNPICKCLEGFEPKNQREWSAGNYSGGCGRQLPLSCGASDQFVKYAEINLPDHFLWFRNKSAVECEAECASNCHCTAYAFSDRSSQGFTDLRCLVWHGDLKDLVFYPEKGGDLFVRIAASDGGAHTSWSSQKSRVVLLVVLLGAAGLMCLLLTCYVWIKRLKIQRQRKDRKFSTAPGAKERATTVGLENDITTLPLLDFRTISAATDSFSSGNKLGQGGFGPVYKGELANGQEIAVKRLCKKSTQGFEEFKNEVELIAKLQHRNLVRLLGWCSYKDDNILIYEYLPNKSLDKFIFDPNLSSQLNWSLRYKIIQGIAQGLVYLHRHSRLRVIHRDLKPSNILLDGSLNPKISDFGLARIFGGNQMEANTMRVVGTFGYMSPEYALDGIFSEKSDVFSFGVIVLETITGKRSTGYYPYKGSLILLGYAWQLWEEGRYLDLVDSSIISSISANEVAKCLQVGLLCIQENAADRPTMPSVVSMLTGEDAPLPLPRKPAFTFPVNGNRVPISPNDQGFMSPSNGLTVTDEEGR